MLEALGQEPDLQSVMHVIVDRMATHFGLAQVIIVLFRKEDEFGYLVDKGEHHLDNIVLRISDYSPLLHVARARESILVDPRVGTALREGKPWHDLDDAQTTQNPALEHARLAPLIRKSEIAGAVLVQATRDQVDDAQLLCVSRLVAALTSIGLGNALEQDLLLTERRALLRDKATAAQRVADLEAFETFFERAQDGIIVCSTNGTIRFVNAAAARILRTSPEQLEHRDFVELLNERYHEWARRHLSSSSPSSRGTGDGYIDLLVPVTGSEVVISAAIRPMADAQSSLITFRDVTELREIETELWKTKDFLENLIQSSVDAIIACDTGGRIILFNRAAEHVLGHDAEEVVGRLDFDAMFPPDEASDIFMRLRRDPHGRVDTSRKTLLDKAGQTIPVNMTAATIYEGEREVAFVAIFTDLRERLRMEEKLSIVERKLRQSERRAVAIELAGVAAHELNQPLTSIMGYAELLKRRLQLRTVAAEQKGIGEDEAIEEEKINKPLRVITDEIERIARIVRRLGEITDYKAKSYVGSSQILDLGPHGKDTTRTGKKNNP